MFDTVPDSRKYVTGGRVYRGVRLDPAQDTWIAEQVTRGVYPDISAAIRAHIPVSGPGDPARELVADVRDDGDVVTLELDGRFELASVAPKARVASTIVRLRRKR